METKIISKTEIEFEIIEPKKFKTYSEKDLNQLIEGCDKEIASAQAMIVGANIRKAELLEKLNVFKLPETKTAMEKIEPLVEKI